MGQTKRAEARAGGMCFAIAIAIAIATAAGLPCLGGCAGDDQPILRKSASAKAGAAGVDGETGAAGATAAGGSGSGTAGASGEPMRGYGYITVVSIETPTRAGSMLAGFYANVADRTPGKSPTRETVGPCVVTTYTPDGTASGGIRASLSAGIITMAGGTGPASIKPFSGQYVLGDRPTDGQLYFTAGQSLVFSAAGDVVPAFTATIVAPAVATLTSPVKDGSSASPLSASRTADFPLTFTGTTGKVRASLNGNDATGSSVNVVCGFAASSGTGTIPAAALSKFSPGEARFSADTIEELRTTSGTFDIDLRVLVGMATPAGKEAQDAITLQ